MSISYQEFTRKLSKELTPMYDYLEAQNLVEWLLEHHFGLKRVDLFNFMKEEALPKVLFSDLERLKTGEPIQYILGHGPFYGRDFKVNQHTLIPRNETEELVHLIIKENPKPGLKILDIGTGTGCIPISLSLEMNSPKVYGLDVSEGALEIARENALRNHTQVEFLFCDILKSLPELPKLDIIVSNPPYVPLSQKEEMHKNVVGFEPHLALFVPDSDPLIFYRVIAEKSKDLLNPGGKLYFEIYEDAGSEICSLLQNLGFDQIKLHKDLNGKDRIISAVVA